MRCVLVRLRERIDAIASARPGVAFVSFADSLLVKSNWFVGKFDSSAAYSYEPESLIELMPQIVAAFNEELGLRAYAVIAQGVNEYEDSSLLHSSARGNHISLNSLGYPFAQLFSIDSAARRAIKDGHHLRHELYIDEQFYYSLRFKFEFDKNSPARAEYRDPMSSASHHYICAGLELILSNLDPRRANRTGGIRE